MGTHKIKTRNRTISLLLIAAVLLAMMGDSVHAEVTGQQARERRVPENPVHHCTKLGSSSDYTDWYYVYFGSYPQTEVTGEELTDEIVGADYDENGDAEVGGEKYRRISKNDTNWDNNFGDNDYRYFKWEPIKWRVLQKNDDTLFVMADKGLDCKCYDEKNISITWEKCTLRSWLNDSFYRTAFSVMEQGAIVEQNVVNADNPYYKTEGGNDTRDKVYLPSFEETGNPKYGFCQIYSSFSKSRIFQSSDFAHVRGVLISTNTNYAGSCCWYLRSPGNNTNTVVYVSRQGFVFSEGDRVNINYQAVVPVLHIKLSSDLWTTEEDDNGHEHDFTKKSLTEEYLESPANCTKAATYYYACSICDLKGTETYEQGEPLGHDFEITDNGDGTHANICQRCRLSKDKEPHHGGSGNCVTKPRCEVCNAEYGEFDNTIHGETEVRDAKPATCAEEGYTGDTYCKACGAKIETGQAIPTTGNHVWNEGITIKTPNCTDAGEKEYTCTVCGTKKTEEDGEPLGHIWEVTDNGDGTHSGICQRCSLSVDTEPHHGGSGNCVTKPRCEVCNAEYGEFDSTVHGETEVRDAKPATCKEDGYTGDTYCKACDTKIETGQTIPATGNHIWDEGITTKTPDCTQAGEKEYTCNVCGTKKTEEEGKPLGHIWEVTDNGDGTHSGICQRCSLSVDKENHHGGSGNCVTKPRCEVCNAEYGEFDSTVHGDTEVRDAKPATCEEEGYTGDTYCKACGAKIETGQVIPATGNHAWDEGTVTKSPSCTHEGQKEYACTVCGAKRQEMLGKSAHDYETILTKATGFTDGNRMECCNVCGDIKSNRTILHVGSAVLNHTSYTYNGKPKKPSVTLKDTDGKLISSRNYTVSYEGNTQVGNARVTILLKEDYAGVIFRTFEICPEGTAISGKIKAQSEGFQVKWKKRNRNVTGYEVQYSTSKKFTRKTTVTKAIKKKSAGKLTVQNLKPGKKYYVRVRTYKTVKKKNFCSAWSRCRSVTTEN